MLFENKESDWVGGGDSGEACNLTSEGPIGVSQKRGGRTFMAKGVYKGETLILHLNTDLNVKVSYYVL